MWPEITGLKAMGAVRDRGERIVLTPCGMRVRTVIMREFFVAVPDFRDLMRNAIRQETRSPAAGVLRTVRTH